MPKKKAKVQEVVEKAIDDSAKERELEQFDELKAHMKQLVAPIADLVVVDPTSVSAATEVGGNVKAMLKAIEQRRKEAIAPLLARQKAINKYADEICQPLEAAAATIKTRLGDYALVEIANQAAKQAEIEAERRRMEAEVEARRRKELADLEAKQRAEREKVEAEQAARIQAAKEAQDLEAEAASLFGLGEGGLLAQDEAVSDAQAVGENHRQEMQREQAIEQELLQSRMDRERDQRQADLDRQAKANAVPPVKNFQMRWVWTLVDQRDVPRQFCIPSGPLINEAIRKGVREIPGLRIFEEPAVALRGA